MALPVENVESLAVIFALAGLVWGGVVFLRGGLLGGCLAVILAGACFSVPFYKLEVGPVPLTADRLLLALLCLQYVFWRRWGLADPKPAGKAEILLLLFLGVLVVSTFVHDWQGEKGDYQPLAWLVLFYLMPAAIYWIARQSKQTERNALAAFAFFAVFGVYLAGVTLAEYFQLWQLVFPRYIVATAADPAAEFVGRGRGPLLNPIANGLMLSVCLGATLMWWPRLRRPGQVALLAAMALILAALYCTLTRSVWMGAVLVPAVVVGLALTWNWRLPLLIGALAAATLLAATHWDDLLAFKRDKALAAEKTAESVALRPILARIAWNMFQDRPLFGCGYAQYGVEHKAYVHDRETQMALERGRGYIPHNVALSLLTETGLVGLGLFAALLFFWTRDAWRLWADAALPLWARQQGLLFILALAVYLLNGMFHDVSVMAMANMTLFFTAGMTAGLRPLISSGRSLPTPEGG